MGKFGIGARVRNAEGTICEVVGKPKKGVREIRLMGGHWDGAIYWADKSTLEPANDNAGTPSISAGTSENAYFADAPTWVSGQFATTTGGETVAVEGGVDADGHVSIRYDNGQKARLPASWLSPWVPKVGDRVRVARHCNWRGESLPMHAPVGSEHDVTEMRSYFDDKGVATFLLSGGGHNFYTALNVEPVVAPATTALAIEAGKFYRTRDGRKATVETDDKEDNFPLRGTLDGREEVWGRDGAWWIGGATHDKDLVAEWVEPQSAEVAVAEATATPRKFKVGDVVNYIAGKAQGNWQGVTITEVDGPIYIAICPKAGRGGFYDDWIEPAAPPAKFKVGDRVVIARNSRGHDWLGKYIGLVSAISAEDGTLSNPGWSLQGHSYWWPSADLDLAPDAPSIPVGATVTFTATGRLSAYTTDGHAQIVFPGLTPGQNSFALPAKFVTLAN